MAKLLRKVLRRKKKPSKQGDVQEHTSERQRDDYEDLHLYEVEVDSDNYDPLGEIGSNETEDVYDCITPQSDKNYLLVAAIDLGTAASGYCFSFRTDYQTNPLQISTNIWTATTTVLRSSKTPTCILFNSNKEFVAFGFEAQNKYTEVVAEEENSSDWYYFESFKMSLYENKDLSIRTEIKDHIGKPMAAIKVFSDSIKYLKDHLMSRCMSMACGLTDEDVLWTLTVPAVWNDKAKLFMRRAAEIAGIPRSQLFLALEPESGAILCKHIPTEVRRVDDQNCVETFQPGSRYMVVDAGGGTIDITIHEVLEGGKIREVRAANGGPWGGTNVNKAYQAFLEDLLGTETYNDFRENHVDDFIDVMREFEAKKQTMKGDGSSAIMRMPLCLIQHFKDLSESGKISEKYAELVQLKKDKLALNEDLFYSLFKPTIDNITDHLKVVLEKEENISTLLLIGGFAESCFLQNAIRSNFGDKYIIVPNEASLSVLKGSVIFGHNRGIVKSRILKCSYGIECSHDFVKGLHDPAKKYTSQTGILKCRDVFGLIAKMGDSVDIDTASSERYLVVDEPNLEVAKISIYISTILESPRYITQEGCRKIGFIEIPLVGDRNSLNRKIYFSIKFGDTEVKVLCRQDDSRRIKETLLNLLDEDSID